MSDSPPRPAAAPSTSPVGGQAPAFPDETKLQDTVRLIVAAVDPDKIILFGSAARGDMKEHSDFDLLVVKEGARRFDLTTEIYRSVRHIDQGIDIIVATPEDLERYGNSYCLVYYPALREGRVVYEKPKPPGETPVEKSPRVAEEESLSRPGPEPDDAREWIRRARGNLVRAQSAPMAGAYLEDFCFDAQQAAEKALKAVCISRGIQFPYTHELAKLLEVLRASGISVPASLSRAEKLTQYALTTRYPGLARPVTAAEHRDAVQIAEAVVRWAEEQVGCTP